MQLQNVIFEAPYDMRFASNRRLFIMPLSSKKVKSDGSFILAGKISIFMRKENRHAKQTKTTGQRGNSEGRPCQDTTTFKLPWTAKLSSACLSSQTVVFWSANRSNSDSSASIASMEATFGQLFLAHSLLNFHFWFISFAFSNCSTDISMV